MGDWRIHSSGDDTFPIHDPEPPRGSALGWLAGGALYALILLFCVRGLALAPEKSLLGGGEIEGWTWRYWWMKEMVVGAFANGPAYGLHAALTAGSYPEFGNVLDLLVLSWPLERVLGDPLYYNVKILLILFLDCAAMWWFLARVWGRGAGTWLGGLLFGLNPYFLFEVSNGRLRQAVAFTIPLFMLYLFRSWRQGDRRSTLLAGLWMGLTAAFYLYYGMFLGFFTALFVVWHLASGRRQPHAPRFLARLGVVVVVGLVVTVPFVLSYLEQARRGDLPEVAPYGTALPGLQELESPTDTLRPRDMLVASQKRFLVDSLPLDALWNPALQHALPLVAVVLALGGLGRRRGAWLWVGTFALFFALSLGPYLKVGEHAFDLPMPYGAAYRYVPSFSRLFSPIRLQVMLYFALAVLVAIRLQPRRALVAGLTAVAFLVQLEFSGVLPLPTVQLAVAPYYHLLGELPPVGLVEVPFKTGDYLEYNQTVHRQKVLWSFAEGGVPPGYPQGQLAHLARRERVRENSFVRHLEALNREPLRPQPFQDQDLQELRRLGYRLLVLHERGCYYLDPDGGEAVYFRLLEHFRKTLGEPLVETDEPVHRGLLGRRPEDVRDPSWYRMAVFALPEARR